MTIKKSVILLISLALAGCASAPSGKVGTSSVINGVEVWTGGPPPRPYRVIMDANRQAADGSTNYRDQEASIASEARQRGADAVIVVNTVMVVSRIDAFGGRPIMAPRVAAQLIKYQ